MGDKFLRKIVHKYGSQNIHKFSSAYRQIPYSFHNHPFLLHIRPFSSDHNEYLKLHLEVWEYFESMIAQNEASAQFTSSVEQLNSGINCIQNWSSAMDNPLFLPFMRMKIIPLRRLYSWAVPTDEALCAIIKASPGGIVEIGAGTGYWAYLLQQRGVHVAAFDRVPMHGADFNGHHALPADMLSSLPVDLQASCKILESKISSRPSFHPPPFTHIFEGGLDAVHKFKSATLLLCWPPPEVEEESNSANKPQLMALECLNAYQGNTVVYVGEFPVNKYGSYTRAENCGNTAGPEFHKALFAEWNLLQRVRLPHWPLARDEVTIWRRKFGRRTSSVSMSEVMGTRQESDTFICDKKAGEVRLHILKSYEIMWENLVIDLLKKKICIGVHSELSGLESHVLRAWQSRASFFERLGLLSSLWLRKRQK